MEFGETGHGQEEHQNLQVSLLIVLHALRLECEKSMDSFLPSLLLLLL